MVHIDPHIYINLHVKYDKNLSSANKKYENNFICFRVMLGPSIKFRGADFITVETYVQQGKTIENQLFIYGPKCLNTLGGGGGFQ